MHAWALAFASGLWLESSTFYQVWHCLKWKHNWAFGPGMESSSRGLFVAGCMALCLMRACLPLGLPIEAYFSLLYIEWCELLSLTCVYREDAWSFSVPWGWGLGPLTGAAFYFSALHDVHTYHKRSMLGCLAFAWQPIRASSQYLNIAGFLYLSLIKECLEIYKLLKHHLHSSTTQEVWFSPRRGHAQTFSPPWCLDLGPCTWASTQLQYISRYMELPVVKARSGHRPSLALWHLRFEEPWFTIFLTRTKTKT